MNKKLLLDNIASGLNGRLAELYGTDAVERQKCRYRDAVLRFMELFQSEFDEPESQAIHLFRAPGRTEIGGNHTDHQHGQVLAAGIDRDILAVAAYSAKSSRKIRIYSEGHGWIEFDLDKWAPGEIDPAEAGTAKALIHGMVDGMQKAGFRAEGFCAYIVSDVPGGAGISSSAAFEILIGTIINGMFNDDAARAEEIAITAQIAENLYYGKPSGLMDQMVSAVGGLCHIDFKDPAAPAVRKLDVDFSELGYCICLTDTHGSHAEYTEDYTRVLEDLAAAASVFGKEFLVDVSQEDVVAHSREIREAGSDRAFLRAMHVTAENERVAAEADALERKDATAFLKLVRESGDSSYKLLQNVHVDRKPERQELAVALAISDAEGSSASRVHGGGFAGTMQAFVPEAAVKEYIKIMDEAFGAGSCFVIRVCPEGGMQLA